MGKGAESPFLHLPHLIRSINDPEHPLTLEELNVVEQVRVQVSHSRRPRGAICSGESERLGCAPRGGRFSAHGLLRGSLEGGLVPILWMRKLKSVEVRRLV